MELPYSQEQHTAAWFRARLGMVTGSKVGTLMKKGKKKDEPFSDAAYTYLYQVAGERTLAPGIVEDDDMLKYYIEQTSATSKAMRFGTEQEENARNLYIEMTGNKVQEVGLCKHQRIARFGSSPDGIVEEGATLGCLEIKCPTPGKYAQYVSEVKDNESLKRINPDYYYQCQAHMACTEGAFCDFVVYCPFLSSPIRIIRISRDPADISDMETRVQMACAIIDNKQTEILKA